MAVGRSGHHRTRRVVIVSIGAALAVPVLAIAPTAAADPPNTQGAVPIVAARALPIGTVVTVAGSAITPAGAFESSFYDKGFGLQDDTAGLFVSSRTPLDVQPGARVRVTGTLTDASGLLTIVPANPDQIERFPGNPQIPPMHATTGSIGESTEGKLVRVDGRITAAPTSDLPYGDKFEVDDGSGHVVIFVNTQTGIDTSNLQPGQRVQITGFSSQYADHYEIDPRSPDDVKPLGG